MEILGQEHIKITTHSADLGRIPHTQLFVGPEGGTLPMAIAYAQYILCVILVKTMVKIKLVI
jgi:DNA polymerase-3 subunit delta'